MVKTVCALSLLMTCLTSWSSTSFAKFEKQIQSPWKTAERVVNPDFKGDTIRISHVKQRTKIHSIVLNDRRVVYEFSKDKNISEPGGQIMAGGKDIVIMLDKRQLIKSLSIKSEGWNRPKRNNIYKVTLTNSIELKHVAKWSGYREKLIPLNKFNRKNLVSSIRLNANGKTKIHTLKLVRKNGSFYDIKAKSSVPTFVQGQIRLDLDKKVSATALLIEAESYSSSSGADTKLTINLARAGGTGSPSPVEPKKCKHDGVTYENGSIWKVETVNREHAYCEFGGNKINVTVLSQQKICRRGVAQNLRPAESKTYTEGRCNAAPKPKRCLHKGTYYQNGQTWSVLKRTKSVPQACRFGGNQVKHYDVYQDKVCRAGTVLNHGSKKEVYSHTTGACKKRPKPKGKSCNTSKGKKLDSDTWVINLNKPIVVPFKCRFGGNRIDTYESNATMKCDDGTVKRVKKWRGKLISTTGACDPHPL